MQRKLVWCLPLLGVLCMSAGCRSNGGPWYSVYSYEWYNPMSRSARTDDIRSPREYADPGVNIENSGYGADGRSYSSQTYPEALGRQESYDDYTRSTDSGSYGTGGYGDRPNRNTPGTGSSASADAVTIPQYGSYGSDASSGAGASPSDAYMATPNQMYGNASNPYGQGGGGYGQEGGSYGGAGSYPDRGYDATARRSDAYGQGPAAPGNASDYGSDYSRETNSPYGRSDYSAGGNSDYSAGSNYDAAIDGIQRAGGSSASGSPGYPDATGVDRSSYTAGANGGAASASQPGQGYGSYSQGSYAPGSTGYDPGSTGYDPGSTGYQPPQPNHGDGGASYSSPSYGSTAGGSAYSSAGGQSAYGASAADGYSPYAPGSTGATSSGPYRYGQ